MSAQPGDGHDRPPVPESDTVIRSSGTVILGSGAIVRSSGTVIRLNEEKKLDQSVVTVISHVTWVGVGVNIVLAVLKLVGGIFGKSQALIADAAHTISDLATDAAVLIGVRYWSEPADAVHPHGHGKIETLVTLIIGIMLAIVGLALGYEAILTLSQGQPSAESLADGVNSTALWLGFAAAILSIIVKELLYRWTATWGTKLKSSALVANAWHHRTDALSSIPPALAIGGSFLGAKLGHNLWFLDPIGAIVVCVMLLHAAAMVAYPALQSLLDAGADRRTCKRIEEIILDTPDVLGAHKIRSRYVGPDAVALDMHIFVDGTFSVAKGHAIASRVRARLLASDLSLVDVVIHVEPVEEQ